MVLKKRKNIKLETLKIYARPWWWRRDYGLWWIKKNKYFKKWKKDRKWHRFLYALNMLNKDNERLFKLKKFYLFKLSIWSFVKQHYGLLGNKTLKILVYSCKKKKNSGLSLMQKLEKRLDVIVSKMPYIRNYKDAQYIIKQGLITVNDSTIRTPNYEVGTGDLVQIDVRIPQVKPFLRFFFKRMRKKRIINKLFIFRKRSASISLVKSPTFNETAFYWLKRDFFSYLINYSR